MAPKRPKELPGNGTDGAHVGALEGEPCAHLAVVVEQFEDDL